MDEASAVVHESQKPLQWPEIHGDWPILHRSTFSKREGHSSTEDWVRSDFVVTKRQQWCFAVQICRQVSQGIQRVLQRSKLFLFKETRDRCREWFPFQRESVSISSSRRSYPANLTLESCTAYPDKSYVRRDIHQDVSGSKQCKCQSQKSLFQRMA